MSSREVGDTPGRRRAVRVLVGTELALNQAITTRAGPADEHQAHLATLSRPIAPEPPQAHLSKPHLPHHPDQERRTRFLEIWAVLSIPLLLISIAAIRSARPSALDRECPCRIRPRRVVVGLRPVPTA